MFCADAFGCRYRHLRERMADFTTLTADVASRANAASMNNTRRAHIAISGNMGTIPALSAHQGGSRTAHQMPHSFYARCISTLCRFPLPHNKCFIGRT